MAAVSIGFPAPFNSNNHCSHDPRREVSSAYCARGVEGKLASTSYSLAGRVWPRETIIASCHLVNLAMDADNFSGDEGTND